MKILNEKWTKDDLVICAKNIPIDWYRVGIIDNYKIFDGDPNDLSNTKLIITIDKYPSWRDKHFINCVKDGNTLRSIAYEIYYKLYISDENTDDEEIISCLTRVIPGVLYTCNGQSRFEEFDNYVSEDGTVYSTHIPKNYGYIFDALLYNIVSQDRKKQRHS